MALTPSAAGRKRKAIGDATERSVDVLNAACRLAGVARLHKVPTEVVIRRAGPRIVGAHYVKAATVDYLGIMLDGTGRHVAVEVKRVQPGKTGTTLPLRVIEPHQRAELQAVDVAGGVAVVLVVSGAKLYAVPWRHVHGEITAGEASIRMLPEYEAGPVYLERWVQRDRRMA